MDIALLRDHEELRSLMYAVVKDRFDEPAWRSTKDFQLFSSPQIMDAEYPTQSDRKRLLVLWRQELDRSTLDRDHAALQAILYPQIEGLLDWLPEVRAQSRNYRLYSDKSYFQRCCPTHREREDFIANSQRQWDRDQARLGAELNRAGRFLRRLRDKSLREVRRDDREPGDSSVRQAR